MSLFLCSTRFPKQPHRPVKSFGLLIDVLLQVTVVVSRVTIAGTTWQRRTSEGNDGLWSSFGIQVGSPPQSVRLLPSTSGSSTWVVLPEGCISSDPPTCPEDRGFLYRRNNSATWSLQGLFQLPLYTQSLLGYSGNAYFGFDNITLGWPGSGGPTLRDPQVIAGIATKGFYVGQLGLSARPVNFTDFNNPKMSLLGSLRAEDQIKGTSWGYTAGAAYKPTKVFGSLTFGGYDAARFVRNNLTFTFGADISRDILVGVRDITSSGATPTSLLDSPITAFIDSTVPHIWLPISACKRFEQALGLSWDEQTGLYIVNDTLHETLVARNEEFRFKLGQGVQGGETVDIVVPYKAFDLEITTAETGKKARYFPLRRAQNDSMYTIGRVFFQEAYLFTDYDRQTFSVSQALFPDTNIPKKLTPVIAPSNATATATAQNHHKTSKLLSLPAIAGISIAAFLILAALSAALFFVRRRRKGTTNPETTSSGPEAAEIDGQERPTHEVEGEALKVELDDAEVQRQELMDPEVHEMLGTVLEVQELEGTAVAMPSRTSNG
ncbi:MAG: hypothetical protein M1839_003502 [Geoglossum umbratile]|nr:MAG: hypothetical protein M1839_003502 [Geoglossum umbratile]